MKLARCVPMLVSLFLASCSAAQDETAGDNANDVAPLLAGRKMTPKEVAKALEDAGFDADVIPNMVCAAKYESAFYTEALHHNTNGSTDYGLFQINDELWMDKCGLSVKGLYDPAKNSACAKKVYDSGGLKSWYGYKRHIDECSNYVVE
jgi:lysozyme C